MTRGVIYARYSEGPRQTDQSIEGQVADCRQYAQEHDIEILEVYADRHISGKSIVGREEFQRMMYDAGRHRFDVVIVWKVDRFGRDRQDIAISKMKLKKAGVKLMYARESVPDGPEGIILESVLEGLAEYYSADLRQKVTRGIRESAKKGKYCMSTVPIGYKRDPVTLQVTVDEREAAAVRRAFEMQIAGAKTAEIRQMMNDMGILTSRGKPVSAGTVYRMLRNEKYVGKWQLAGVDLDVPGIISQETFDEAARHFHTSRNNAAGTAQTDYLLSCKCFCGICGSLMIGESGTGRNGRVYNYYKCSGKKHRKNGCTSRPISAKTLEDVVVDATVKNVLKGEVIDRIVERALEVQATDLSADPASVFRSRLEENKKKQERLLDAIEEGAGRAIGKRLAELEAEEDELVLQIQQAEIRQPRLTGDQIRAFLESFRSGDAEDAAFRQKLVETFVAKVEVWPDHVVIWYNIQDGPGAGKVSTTVSTSPLSGSWSKRPELAVVGRFIVLAVKIPTR